MLLLNSHSVARWFICKEPRDEEEVGKIIEKLDESEGNILEDRNIILFLKESTLNEMVDNLKGVGDRSKGVGEDMVYNISCN